MSNSALLLNSIVNLVLVSSFIIDNKWDFTNDAVPLAIINHLVSVISPLKRLKSLSVVREFNWISGVGCGRSLFLCLNILWFGGSCLINLPQMINSREGIFPMLKFVVRVIMRKSIPPICFFFPFCSPSLEVVSFYFVYLL